MHTQDVYISKPHDYPLPVPGYHGAQGNNLMPCLILNYAFQAALVLCHELCSNDAGYGMLIH